MSLEELYREVILDHYRNPRNRAPVPNPDAKAEGVNPLCGDEVTVELSFDDGRVGAVAVRGQGCSISQSSGSMMSEAIKGRTLAEVRDLIARFKALMDIEGSLELDPDRPGAVLGDLEALQGVKRYPVRIKCAALPWTTLEQALDS
ncbi:MAG: iron-sulfur cluster assembly scaffold protein [Acidimicrobiia bacterium]|jgi:nitrogen fixation NifU-like protein|nr:MAG: iron-sulfur cluster assembly scaffold protein [Acidimicrobiia bacterium]